ncbi:class I SAM-dependent DNA methyltransferase [Glacieibacterium frigidum]|uniref:site-specific DNA-methyltransferase (adenine-specific) n=1 Tax=Glacieibacterium frigidum TaxID=2593303 RepID=A0A552UA91_9SPHN|nr:class I SAM-dependent DNA methyltransferase [Glacieibacterium frigidum]TRW15137.1 N-6 DNA methylase [Glacieibacterium frigidum]
MVDSALRAQIDALWNQFWTGGITNPLSVIEQITFLIYARLLDVREEAEEARARRLGQPHASRFDDEELRWRVWKHWSGDKLLAHVRDRVFPHLRRSGGDGGTMAAFMADAQLLIQKPSLLVTAVAAVDKLPLTQGDTKGDLYEYLLSKLTTAGINGQFRTPRHIIELMVDLVDPQPGERVGDPACGTGGFLMETIKHLLQNASSTEHPDSGDRLAPAQWDHLRSDAVHGFDFDATMLRIAAMNLMLHGVDAPGVHYQDTLSGKFVGGRNTALAMDAFDVVLANPPFKGSLDTEDVAPDLLRAVKTRKTELLFLVLILRLLRVGGRSATIVPDGVLFGSSAAHKGMRALLVDQHQLDAVISLPAGVFKPYAGVSTAILVFTKGGRTGDIFMYDLENDGYSLDDKRTPVGGSQLHDVLTAWSARGKAGLGDRMSSAFTVPVAEVRARGYDLSVSRWRERPAEVRDFEPPHIILARMKEIEAEIARDLAELEGLLG